MATLQQTEVSKAKYSKQYTRFYEVYNTLYFNGRLPKIKVLIGPLPNQGSFPTYARTYFSDKTKRAKCIILNRELRKWRCTHLLSLLHEMCHVSIGVIEDNHGPIFEAEKERIIKMGALNDLL